MWLLLVPASTLALSRFPLFQATGMGDLPRVGDDDERIHARSDGRRPQVARRIRSRLFQVRRPHQALQAQETTKTRTSLQPLRGTQRLAYFSRAPIQIKDAAYFSRRWDSVVIGNTSITFPDIAMFTFCVLTEKK